MANEMTLAEAATRLNPPVSKQTLDYHRKKGHITTRKSGRIHLVNLSVLQKELEDYARSQSNKKYVRKIIATEDTGKKQIESAQDEKA